MPRVVLHIGMHKTGTSAIQAALSQTEGEAFLYPVAGRRDGRALAHHGLAQSVVQRYARARQAHRKNELWEQLRAEIESSRSDVAVLSSELFWPAEAGEIEQIARYLNGLDVTVVLYVRNHWKYMISAFKQHVKGGAAPIDSLCQLMEEKLWMVDYDQHIGRWANHFEVEVRVYDKVKTGLLDDFGQVIGCNIAGKETLERNVSPDDAVIWLVLALNILKRRWPVVDNSLMQRVRRNLLKERVPGRWVAAVARILLSHPIGAEEDRAWLREATADARARFLERYVTEEDQHYFDF